MSRIKLCVVGADGRMGQEILRSIGDDFEVVGAITYRGSPNEGKTLDELGLRQRKIVITNPDSLDKLLSNSDIYLSFTTPEAEMQNLPIAVKLGKKIILGTTGFSSDQVKKIKAMIEGTTEAVFASNFSIGINFLAGLLERVSQLPPEFDASMLEIHHTGKIDSPSGTAIYLADIVKKARGYSKDVHGRSGKGKRSPDEMETVSMRTGGVPGIHEIVFAGPNEMIRIEHTAFSRRVFADGALLASRWVMRINDKKLHSMKEVLGV